MTGAFRDWAAVAALAITAAVSGCGGSDSSAPAVSSSGGGGSGGGGGGTSGSSGKIPSDLSKTPFLLGQTTPQQFAVFGYMVAAKGGAWEDVTNPATLDPATDLGLRMPTDKTLAIRIGSYGEGAVEPNGGGGVSASGEVVQVLFNALGGAGGFNLLYDASGQPLTRVALAAWSRVARSSGEYPLDHAAFVYGVPTPAGQVPTSGTATYRDYGGAGPVTIDFASRVVTATFVFDKTSLAITGCTIASGTSAFSCAMQSADGSVPGHIDGQLASANGNELLGRAVAELPGGKGVILIGMGRAS